MVDLYRSSVSDILPKIYSYVEYHNAFMKGCENLRGTLQHLSADPNTTIDQRVTIKATRDALQELMAAAGDAMHDEVYQVGLEISEVLKTVRRR